ncbi:DUF6338 family protein [Comamonas sp. SCN 65-56]|uniref:DUF6338 family protein n=1 Tax=Comamonas sp. SCN 65-56 TaxID=1660095 RepID=UPI0025BEA241|nr:DUF6338 family protein [Comamonas sp. SCN 65-56]
MDIWGANKLLLFIAFAIPGFISLKSYEVLCPSSGKSSSDRLIDVVTYSCINYAILYLPIRWVEVSDIPKNSPFCYYIFYLLVLIIAPFMWALLWKKIRTSEFFQKNAPHPTEKPWDFLFEQRKPYWVKVTLNNGKIIAGRYDSRSFASSAPADEQIYLEETWILDEHGAFLRKIDRTSGTLILANNISHVELRE